MKSRIDTEALGNPASSFVSFLRAKSDWEAGSEQKGASLTIARAIWDKAGNDL